MVAGWCAGESERRLNGTNFKWGDTGPALVSEAIRQLKTVQVVVPPFRMLGGFGGNEIASYLDTGYPILESHVRVIHWFRSAAGPERFARIKNHLPLNAADYGIEN